MERAKQLLLTQKRENAEASLAPLEFAIEVCPGWEKALELKARTLLSLQKFKDVVEMLHEYVPSLMPPSSSPLPLPSQRVSSPPSPIALPESPASKEKMRLLSGYDPDRDEFLLLSPLTHCFSIANLRQRLSARLSHKKVEKRQQWRYLVLGQACWHLGMLEDAMVLLQSGKKTASVAFRRRSNGMREDSFSASVELSSHHRNEMAPADVDMVAQMLGNIKFLLRRRTAALAALEAGLYAESVRHFSKVIDGRKGSPQGFIADCYLHRAIAYQATGRVVDAIADCNRSLALSPHCTKALSIRASLYEMIRCFSECLLDLQQLKMIYEASLRHQMLPEPRAWTMRQQYVSNVDLAGGLDYINSKIMAARQRLSGGCSLDAHTILDMPRSCTMDDVKRAYLVLSLKHRPDMATHFINRCELVDDDRDMETVREEMHASAHRLSQLIHKAYTKILSCIAEEKETEKKGKQGRSRLEGTEQLNEAPLIQLEEGASLSNEEECDRVCKSDWESGECSKKGEVMVQRSFDFYKVRADEGRAFAYYEGMGGEEERDACDFCQPFGGLTTTGLANALSQALLNDLPISANPSAPTGWMPDWSLAISQPVHVT